MHNYRVQLSRSNSCIIYLIGPNVLIDKEEVTTDDHRKSDGTESSSFLASFQTLKPGTHSTPKTGHTQPSSNDSVSFDEDSYWGAYFSPPQSTSSSSKSTPKKSNSLEKSLNKHDKTSPTLGTSEVTQSLSSPTLTTSKSGPLKLSSSKNKNRPKAKQVGSGKPVSQSDDSTTKVTKELATSSSDSLTGTNSSMNANENVEKQVDNSIQSAANDEEVLQPVTTSELLLLASTENTEVLSSHSSSSDVNTVTGNKRNQPEAANIPAQLTTEDVDSAVAILPTTTTEPVTSQSATNEVNMVVDSVDAEIDKVKSESNLNKETLLSSPIPEITTTTSTTTTSQSDEISSTSEYVIVSKETMPTEPTMEPVSDTDKHPTTELLLSTEAITSNSAVEQKDLLEVEDNLEEKQTEQVTTVSDGVEQHKLKDNNLDNNNLPNTDTVTTVMDSNQASGDLHHASKDHEEELQHLKNVSLK